MLVTPEARLRDLVGQYGDQLPPRVAVAIRDLISDVLADAARAICPLCRREVPHHTNGREGIGDAARTPVYDLHAVEDTGGVGLAECLAYPIWVLRG